MNPSYQSSGLDAAVRGAFRMLLAVAAALLPAVACTPPMPDALFAPDGSLIHLDEVGSIVNNPALTDAQKRDRLAELGITDPDLIDYLIRQANGQ